MEKKIITIKTLRELNALIAEKITLEKPEILYRVSHDGGKSYLASCESQKSADDYVRNAHKNCVFSKPLKVFPVVLYSPYSSVLSYAWKIVESRGWNDKKGFNNFYFRVAQHPEDWEVVIVEKDKNYKFKNSWQAIHKDVKIALCMAALKTKGIYVEVPLSFLPDDCDSQESRDRLGVPQ